MASEVSGDYFILRLHGVNAGAEKWLSQQAFHYGALGMSEALGFQQPEGEEDVFITIGDKRSIDIYFDNPPDGEFLRTIESRHPELRFEVLGEKNKDWLAEWKKGFVPFALSERHWVVPSWCEVPPEARFAIRIDPGMAFGTGTHETTRLVARVLEALMVREGAPQSLLDVGTGTGILAILAAQLGVKQVTATEIEPEARRVAFENFSRNQVAVTLDDRQVESLSDTYDIVVANIIDGVLVRIQEVLKNRVKTGGWLLVSGIISEREPHFLRDFHLPSGRAWDIRRQEGDWICYGAHL